MNVRFIAKGFPMGDVYSDWVAVDPASASPEASGVEALQTFYEIYCTQQSDYIAGLDLEWELRVNEDDDDIRDIDGESVNPFYLTRANPSVSGPLYHTVVHTGCVAAKGFTTEDAVFDAIWGKFAGLSIKQVELQNGVVVETDLLRYYGRNSTDTTILNGLEIESIGGVIQAPSQFASVAREQSNKGLTAATATSSLLIHQDGKCGVWQYFAIDVFGTQGIAVSVLDIVVKPGISVNSFKVQSGTAGQGTANPKESIWGDHAVIEFGGKVYDPSYGLEYGIKSNALGEFMRQSVGSVGTTRVKNAGESTFGYGWVYVAMMGPYVSASTYFEWD